jgi:ABC-type polysaccharide/polyol phosphate export permease
VVPELRTQRDLLRLACKRQILVKYRRSVLGLAWVLLTPMLMALVMFAVFKTIFGPQAIKGWPFLAYVHSGITVFSFFSQSSLDVAPSLRSSAGILTRTSAAPEVFVLSAVASGLVTFGASTAILVTILLVAGKGLSIAVLLIVPSAIALGFLSLGVGAFISHFAIQYEDVNALTNVGMTILGYLVPSFYPVTIIPKSWRGLYEVNPLVPLLDMYRSAFGYPASIDWWHKSAAITFSVVLGLVSLHSFRRRWPRVVTEL